MLRPSIATLALLAILVTGCVPRARYRDFVSEKTRGPDVKLTLSAKDQTPLGNVKLEMSEWKNKIYVTTGPDGTFALPVDKKYLDENPVIVVVLPKGVTGYTITPAPAESAAPAPVPTTL